MPSNAFTSLRHRLERAISDESARMKSVNGEEGKKVWKVPFYTNRSGFPIDQPTWDRLWEHAMTIYPEAVYLIENIRNCANCAEVPVPVPPVHPPHASAIDCLRSIQSYMLSFTYNHTGTQLFDIKKTRPFHGLMEVAKCMVREALPIKCLEATILGMYLTSELTNVNRFPIGFKSVHKGNSHFHVVLGISYAGMYGTIGISRRQELMDKPIAFTSLAAMLENFSLSYMKYGHEMKKVKLGSNIPHDIHSGERVQWKAITITYTALNMAERRKKIDKFSKLLRANKLPPPSPPRSSASPPQSSPLPNSLNHLYPKKSTSRNIASHFKRPGSGGRRKKSSGKSALHKRSNRRIGIA